MQLLHLADLFGGGAAGERSAARVEQQPQPLQPEVTREQRQHSSLLSLQLSTALLLHFSVPHNPYKHCFETHRHLPNAHTHSASPGRHLAAHAQFVFRSAFYYVPRSPSMIQLVGGRGSFAMSTAAESSGAGTGRGAEETGRGEEEPDSKKKRQVRVWADGWFVGLHCMH